jgi:type II secretory pathway pseudopilin PulG
MTLIEAVIASSIFVIVLSMVLVMISTLDATTTRAVQTAQETEQAQTAASFLEQYLSGAVSPMVAAVSAGNPSTESAPALTGTGTISPCWGASQPSSGTATAGTNAQTVSQPSRIAVTVAHDYDLVFCADKPDTSIPQLYEIDLANCTSKTYGNCSLQITDYGSSCAPGTGSPSDSATGSTCSTSGKVVKSIPHVWCDSYCQGSTGSGTNPQGTSVAKTCWTTSGPTTGVCPGHTPPLFEYFSSTGQYSATGTQDAASINYEVETGGAPSCATGTTLFVDLVDNGSCDDAAGDLGSIQLIVFNVTILNQNGMPVSTSSSNIGSQIDDQVLLGNQFGSSAACGQTAVESAAPPDAYFPLDDTGLPLDDLGDASDLQADATSGVEFNQTPGPLPCNRSNGGMLVPNTTAGTTSNYAYSSAFNSGFASSVGNSVTIEAWFSPQTATQTCSSYCAIVSDGDGIETSGYSGVELVVEPNWAGVAVAANGASTTAVEANGVPFSCTGTCGPSSGYWYLAVGVITISATGTSLTTYLCGPSISTGCSSGTGSSTHTTIAYGSGCDLMIGASPFSGSTACNLPTSAAQGFDGYVSDTTVYQAPLTANQIKTQYYEMSQ